MTVLLDTSVLIGAEAPTDVPSAISVMSLAELRYGVLVAADEAERDRRIARLAAIEQTFDPLPVDDRVGTEHANLCAAVRERSRNERRRAVDLLIAATARAYGFTLLTYNLSDFADLAELLDVRAP
jgi:predicted nucleic acid-binding protein